MDTNGPTASAVNDQSRLAVHRVNLYRPLPTSINSMALSPCDRFLAVIRGFANVRAALDRLSTPICTIEIFRIHPDGQNECLTRIHQQESLQSIAWFDSDTVATVSLNQNINLYNIHSGESIHQEMIDYGAIYCMKHEPSLSLLLVGTEYGYVCAYKCDYKTKRVLFWKKLVKVASRIMSLDCYVKKIENNVDRKKSTPKKASKRKKAPTSDTSDTDSSSDEEPDESVNYDIKVFGGSMGVVVVWDFKTESILETIHVGDDGTTVWALLTTNSGELVTGDSTGTTCIYDADTFVCKQQLSLHSADVLCLAKNREENEIYISGVDSTIRSIGRYSDSWVPKTKRIAHTHDVRSLTTYKDNELYSGGSDYFLTHTRYPDARKVYSMPNLTENVKFNYPDELMVQNEASVVIWKLAGYNLNEVNNHASGYAIPLESAPQKIVELRTRSYILSSTFNSSWICYYTIGASNISLYNRSQSHKNLKKHKSTTKLSDCHKMELVEIDSRHFLVTISSDSLTLLDLEPTGEDEKYCNVADEQKLDYNVQQLYCFESKFIMTSRPGIDESKFYLYEIGVDHKIQLIRMMDLGSVNIGCISTYPTYLHQDNPELFFYTHDCSLIKVNLVDFTLTKDIVYDLPQPSSIIGLFFITHQGKQVIALYDHQNIFKLSVDERGYRNVNTITRYNHILKIVNTSNKHGTDELCLVELTPEQLIKLLPPLAKRKKFGS